jgi:hypothetical protein
VVVSQSLPESAIDTRTTSGVPLPFVSAGHQSWFHDVSRYRASTDGLPENIVDVTAASLHATVFRPREVDDHDERLPAARDERRRAGMPASSVSSATAPPATP